jgi:GNAT superfamily N-acetyltransferase
MEKTKDCFRIFMEIMEKQIVISSFNQAPPIGGLVTLAKSYYDSGEIISDDYLSWQYNRNPSGFPFYALANYGEQIVGQYIVIPIRYRYQESMYSGTLSLNTLTHPDFQGKGLFTKLANSTYELCSSKTVDFTIGFPNPLSHGGFIKKLDFQEIGRCNLLVKPIRPFNLFKDFLKRKKFKHGGDIPFNWKTINKDGVQLTNFGLTQHEEYTIFWESLSKSKIMIDKDFEFLKWRYFDIPGRKYHVIQAKRENKITAICVLRIEKVLMTNTAIIMDFFVLDAHISDGNVLLKSILKELKHQQVNLVSLIESFDKPILKILKQNNFRKVPKRFLPQPIPVIFRAHRELKEIEKINEFSNWSFSFGDYDIF